MAHPTPHDTHTHTYKYTYTISYFSCPGVADVTGETMNLTYRSGDAYLGCGKPSGDVERERNKSLVAWQIDTPSERPWNLKEKVIKNERKFKIQSQRDLLLRMSSFCSPFSFSGAIRPFLWEKKKWQGKGRKKREKQREPDWSERWMVKQNREMRNRRDSLRVAFVFAFSVSVAL